MSHKTPYDLSTISVLAIDPGKMTGIAVFDGTDLGVTEVESNVADEYIFNLITRYRPMSVVCESFRITVQTAKNTQAPWSLELIGVTRLASKLANSSFRLQTPADAKGFATDVKLKALGWYNSSKGGHQNDATRHLLTELVRMGWWDDRLVRG